MNQYKRRLQCQEKVRMEAWRHKLKHRRKPGAAKRKPAKAKTRIKKEVISSATLIKVRNKTLIKTIKIAARNQKWVEIPESFSFLEDPEAVLQFISQLRIDLMRGDLQEIHLDHSKCRKLGLCAQA